MSEINRNTSGHSDQATPARAVDDVIANDDLVESAKVMVPRPPRRPAVTAYDGANSYDSPTAHYD